MGERSKSGEANSLAGFVDGIRGIPTVRRILLYKDSVQSGFEAVRVIFDSEPGDWGPRDEIYSIGTRNNLATKGYFLYLESTSDDPAELFDAIGKEGVVIFDRDEEEKRDRHAIARFESESPAVS